MGLVVRDRWWWSEPLSYAPVVVPLAVLVVGLGCWRPRPRWLAAMLVSGVVLAAVSLLVEQPNLVRVATGPTESPGAGIRLTMWNVMSFNRGEEEVTATYRGDDADIVCLLEGTYRGRPPDFLVRGLGPGYGWASTRQMAVGSRLPIIESGEVASDTRLRALRVVVDTGAGGRLTVLLVDVPGPPRLDSRELFNELWATLQLVEGPVVVVGDFNTPRGSYHLGRATRGFEDFYRHPSAPRWLATWPSAMPLYQIDHAFAGGGVRPLEARIGSTPHSDHRRLVIRFAMPGGG